MIRVPALLFLLFGVYLLTPQSAEAVPAYARKYQLACSQCHSAWPILNKFGRTFKENGYRLDRTRATPAPDANEIEIDDTLRLERVIPMSMRVQGRPYVKRNTDSRFDMQVAHELELQLTGSGGRAVSYFVNVEAADDADWAVELADLVGGWHPHEMANVVGGYGPLTFADPYNTFAHRRLTQDRPSPNSAGFESGYRFRDSTQFVTFYGRGGDLFYSASVGTGAGDPLGADRKDFFVRAMYDLPVGLSLGAFALVGDRELTTPLRTQDYVRTGLDLQYTSRGLTANAAFYRATEDAAGTLLEQRNDAWYVQAFYVTPTRVPVVPLVRYESVESANGSAATRSIALAAVAYVRGNVSVSLDLTKQTQVPPGRSKTNRVSALVILGL